MFIFSVYKWYNIYSYQYCDSSIVLSKFQLRLKVISIKWKLKLQKKSNKILLTIITSLQRMYIIIQFLILS